MNRRIVFVAIILAFVTSVAMAGETGFYLGAGVGQTYTKVKDSSVDVNISGDATGYKVFGGYNFLKFLGAEASYRDLGSIKDQSGSIDVKVEGTTWDAFLVGKLPIGFFEPFVKVGYSYFSSKATSSGEDSEGSSMSGSDSDSGWDLAYGAGFGFNLGKNMHLRAEYEQFDISPKYGDFEPNVDVYMISASFAWRF